MTGGLPLHGRDHRVGGSDPIPGFTNFGWGGTFMRGMVSSGGYAIVFDGTEENPSFTVTRSGDDNNIYFVEFASPFDGDIVVVVTNVDGGTVELTDRDPANFTVHTYNILGEARDQTFTFIVLGP